jgi:acetylornithine/succinyldiaminopimelate/putrescine aminotransferase
MIGIISGLSANIYMTRHDNEYLDLLSGFGVYAFGRNHPTIINALKEVLSLEMPDLVQTRCFHTERLAGKRDSDYHTG